LIEVCSRYLLTRDTWVPLKIFWCNRNLDLLGFDHLKSAEPLFHECRLGHFVISWKGKILVGDEGFHMETNGGKYYTYI
jgi:hypothetical protein